MKQTTLLAFEEILLPRDAVVEVRCLQCGKQETRLVEQAGLRCVSCGSCVTVVSDTGRHTRTEPTEVRRYWRQGEADPICCGGGV